MTDIILQNLKKSYGAVEVVRGINLEIASNEFVVLVGPSGCGKTTTLRMIAGLETVSSGMISIGGRVVNDVAAYQRDIAMVFQNYALFPHLTVRKNMAFGMWIRRTPKDEIDRRIRETADALGLAELLDRRPGQLSGGQRQRVAMGRAMVRDPKVFLFDEPLSNLDAKLRIQMRAEIRRVHERVATTAVYVTHDQIEAMTLADRIVVMNRGNIEQVGTPHELYSRPRTAFVAGFIGSPSMNFLPCRLEQTDGTLYVILGNGLRFAVPPERVDAYAQWSDKRMTIGIRPEHITERRAHVGKAQVDFDAPVEFVEPMGNDTMVFLRIGDVDIAARCSPEAAKGRGASMSFSIDMDHMHLIDPESQEVIPTEASNGPGLKLPGNR